MRKDLPDQPVNSFAVLVCFPKRLDAIAEEIFATISDMEGAVRVTTSGNSDTISGQLDQFRGQPVTVVLDHQNFANPLTFEELVRRYRMARFVIISDIQPDPEKWYYLKPDEAPFYIPASWVGTEKLRPAICKVNLGQQPNLDT